MTLLRHKDTRRELGLASFYRRGEFVLYLQSSLDAEPLWAALRRAAKTAGGAANDAFLPEGSKVPCVDKYDYLLPPELLAKQYRANMLDSEELKAALGEP
jgi:hypothetical protein